MAEPGEANVAARREATQAAREARRQARLAEEEQRRDRLVNGLKGKAYRTARQTAVPGACKGLALAAEQAGKTNPDDLPEAVRDSSRMAADLARPYAGREPLPNGQPDWPRVAGDLRGLAAAPPPEMGMGLSLAFLLAGRKEFALCEIELIDASALNTREQKTCYHLLRGFLYSVNGLPLLAGEEITQAPALGEEQKKHYGPELLAGIHLALACLHLRAKDYEKADREVVLALRAWPNNDVAVFLTGERLAATGEYEKAANSLEALARNTDQEWLARKVAQRACDLRDRPGEADTLLHDERFLLDVMLHYLAIAAQKSETARQLQQSVAAMRAFSQKVLDLVPGS
jgi:tetratricopeptide (TPR) repeat protein